MLPTFKNLPRLPIYVGEPAQTPAADQPPGNAGVQHKAPHATDTATATAQPANGTAPHDKGNITVDLVELHRTASASQVSFPDDSQQKIEQEKNNEKARVLQSQVKTDADKATFKRTDSDSAVVDGDDTISRSSSSSTIEVAPQVSPSALRQKLRALERQRQRAEQRNQEKEARRIQRDIDATQRKLSALSSDTDDTTRIVSTPTKARAQADAATPQASPQDYDLNHIRSLLRQRLEKVPELTQAIMALETAMVDGDDAEHQQAMQELGTLQQDISYLTHMLQFAASPDKPRAKVSPGMMRARPETTTTTTTTVTTTTTTTTTSPTTTTKIASSEAEAHLTSIHQIARNSIRNSSLLFNEDLRPYFSQNALEEIQAIDKEIEKRADRADAQKQQAKKLRAQLDDSESDVEGAKGRERMSVRVDKLDAAAMKEWLAIAKLLERRGKLEGKVIAAVDAKSPKQLEEEYQAFVISCKSVQTRGLEQIHKDALAKLEAKVNASPGWANAWTMAAGAAGFGVSFFLSNTFWRLVPLGSHTWIGVIGAPITGGLFHVIFATPMVKQIMTRTWTSNSMSALNNNFKLKGAYLGDQRRGELDVRKYDSKDPNRTEKLTIGERLAEEAPFRGMFAARYTDEEAGYYFYTLNYCFKALAAGCMSSYFASGTMESKLLEAGLHGILGFCSGAEYVASQQHARSERPNAKVSVVPTREVFAHEARALQSLRDDLNAKLEACRANADPDPKDPTQRMLTKAIRRTDKALMIASLKSRPAGILRHEFWAQFSPEAWEDTLSEVLGRIVSLSPTAVLAEFLSSWRKSPDPLLMFLGHALPAVLLIMPPGFTSRPLYSGAIRALMQSFHEEKARKAQTVSKPVVPKPDDDSLVSTVDGNQESTQESQRSRVSRTSRDLDESVVVSEADDQPDDSDDAWHGNPTKRDEDGGW